MKTIDKVACTLMNGLTKFVKAHPVISYVVGVGPACLLMAAGYVAIQEGVYLTEDEKEN